MPFDQLYSAIMALPDTGAAGFEGFVRDALAELTGQAFRLMKSGPQGGVDCIGDPSGSGLVIGMEGKQYSAKTPLALDALKSKLRDAAKEFPTMDLWLLATTRPIDGGHTKALLEIGDDLGVDVLVLDWSDAAAMPPSLAIIAAAAPAAVAHHLGPSVTGDIAAITSNAYFASERDRLRERLRNASIGLAAARAATREWTVLQMQDPASARVAFDSYASLEAPRTVRIDRPAVRQALDDWWTNGPPGPAALLGQEGMGKTWAALSWWLARTAGAEDFPLSLVIPARDVSSIDGPQLIANALHKATGVRDPAFWQRRFERWMSAETDRPLLLIIIDGLNQNWTFQHWSDLLLSLNTAERRGKIAVALTCRPEHWRRQLKELADSRLPITIVDVQPFSDPELDALLAAHKIARDELHPKLIELMRVPRLSGIAIERRAELQEGGEITPERLVYEDWRYRHHGAQKALSHEEFRAFIGKLGRELNERLGGSVERKELFERLSPDGVNDRGKLEAVFSELTEGGWLNPSTAPGRFELDAGRVPAALGLALLDDVRGGNSGEERAEILGQLLDPLQGSDLSVAILKNAATFALLDTAASAEVKVELLEAWLGSQNFSAVDFESYWRLIGYAPALFIGIAEEEWFGSGPSKRSDEVLVKGFANALKWPEVATALEAKLLEWFSRYWLDKLQGEILGKVGDDEAAQKRRREGAERAAAAKSERIGEAFGLDLKEVDPERQAWGCYRATDLLSWIPRAPLVQVFTAWAITRAILGGFRQFDALAWVLRWNTEDPVETEAAILSRARELLNCGGEIARSAARSLLDALATPAARQLHDEFFPEAAPTPAREFVWPEVRAERVNRQPLDGALSLEADPHNPDIELPSAFVERLRKLAARVSDDALLASGVELDRSFGRGIHALAHWAPDALGNLVRRRSAAALGATKVPDLPGWALRTWKAIAQRVGRGEPEMALAKVEWLPFSFLVLGDDELKKWSALSHRLDGCGFERPYELQLTALAGTTADEQVRALRRISPPAGLAQWVKRILQPASVDVVESLRMDLAPTRSVKALVMWIDYLRAAALKTVPSGWMPLASLIGHPDPGVRAATFKFIHRSDNDELAQRLEESGWSWTDGMDRDEAAYGSLALTLSPAAAAGAVADRVHPEVLGALAELYPQHRIYLERFADYVRKELEFYNSGSSRTYPRALLNDTQGWDLLVAEFGDSLLEWTRPFVDGSWHSHWFIVERFPLIRALEAADKIEPGRKAQVLGRSLREMAASNFRSGDLYYQATTLAGPTGEEARQLALAEANEDAKIFEFAVGIQESGQTDWLLEQIERDLDGNTAGIMARGLTLAGFLQPTIKSDALWEGELAEPPASGWLAMVHGASRDRYLRYKWSRHWNQLFRNSDSDDEAFGAYELFIETLDGRLFSGNDRPSDEDLRNWSWRRRVHWSIGWARVRSAAKSRNDKLSKEFLASKPPLSNQSPRRH